MKLIQWIILICSCTAIPIVLFLSCLYAYHVNTRRAFDDPKKKNYSPYAPFIAPFTLPLLVLINVILFVLSSLAFGVFLVIFPITLLLFRKPFLIKWLLKQALKIGNWILSVNSWLLRVTGFQSTSIRLVQELKAPV